MKKTAVVFGGQGSQYVGLGKKFFEKYPEIGDLFDELGEPLKKIAFEGTPEEISKTKNLQPIMVTFQLGIWELIKDFVTVDSTCGLSLGEYGALVVSESIDKMDGIKMVKERGKVMEAAAEKEETTMLAVLNMERDDLERFLEKDFPEVFIGNQNSSKQIVVGGRVEEIQNLRKALKSQGHKGIPLKVSAAFHTPFMEEAAEEYEKTLEKIHFQSPKKKYYPNLTGEIYKGEDFPSLLKDQIVSPVMLYKTLKNMIEDGVSTFIEIGPGKVISNILKKEFSDKEIEIYTLSNDEEAIEFVEERRYGKEKNSVC